MAKQTVEFNVDKAGIIRHLIESQSGTLMNAVAELVSNGLDAHATKIDIEIDISAESHTMTVTDNGRGFESMDDILQCFAVLGFDHNTEAQKAKGRSIGAYGLGRMQLGSWAASTWETNQFRMHMDVKDRTKAAAFDLEECEDVLHKGCRITAEFYKPLNRRAVEELKSELRRKIRYVPVSVTLNGEELTDTDRGWTYEDDDFYFLHRRDASSGVEVYNLGVLVRYYPTSQCSGVSGVLVSKREPFKLNMARNELLIAEDALWPKAKKIFSQYAEKRTSKMKDSDREAMVQAQIAGEGIATFDFAKKRVFLDCKGRTASLNMILSHANGCITMAPRRASQIAEHVHNAKTAFVLDRRMLDWLNIDRVEDAAAVLHRLQYGDRDHCLAPAFTVVDFAEVSAAFAGKARLVEPNQIKKSEKAMLAALLPVLDYLLRRTAYSMNVQMHRAPRQLVLGKSESAVAWTDGSTYVAVDRDHLSRWYANPNALMSGIMVLLHECCHDSRTDDDHVHGLEFYERFESVATAAYMELWSMVNDTMLRWEKERKKLNLTTSKPVLRALTKVDEAVITGRKHTPVDEAESDEVLSPKETAPAKKKAAAKKKPRKSGKGDTTDAPYESQPSLF